MSRASTAATAASISPSVRRRDVAARQRLVGHPGLAEERVERKRDRRQPDGDQRRGGQPIARGRRRRATRPGRRREEAARRFGAGALRLGLRQQAALDVALDFLELRLVERRFAWRRHPPSRPTAARSSGQSAARTARAAIPARTNQTINEPRGGLCEQALGKVRALLSQSKVEVSSKPQLVIFQLPSGCLQPTPWPRFGRPAI